jgi:PAS domain-containing protein
MEGLLSRRTPGLADLIIEGKIEEIPKRYQNICKPSPLIETPGRRPLTSPHFQSGPKWLYFTAAPLHGRDGQIVGAVETLQDVTARKKNMNSNWNIRPITIP